MALAHSDAIGIGEGILSDFEWHIMFLLILFVLFRIPFEAHPIHNGSVPEKIAKSNNNIWLNILLLDPGRREAQPYIRDCPRHISEDGK